MSTSLLPEVSGAPIPSAPAKPPSDPILRKRRVPSVVAIGALALVVALLSGALYSLRGLGGGGSNGPSAADATRTADALNAMRVTQTAAANVVHFPYQAVAPGPGCDSGNAPWGEAYAVVTCSGDHTHYIETNSTLGYGSAITWEATPASPFPHTYTVSIQVRNINPGASVYLTALRGTWEQEQDTIGVETSGLASARCWDTTGSGCVLGDYTYNTRPSGTYTLAIRVDNARVTFLIDGHDIASAAVRAGESTATIDFEVSPSPQCEFVDCPNSQYESADFLNFSIG